MTLISIGVMATKHDHSPSDPQGGPVVAPPVEIPVSPPVLRRFLVWDFFDGRPSFDVTYRPRIKFNLNVMGTAPTEYRISESFDFGNTEWQPWPSSFPVDLELSSDTGGQKTLYAQVRAGAEQDHWSAVLTTHIEYRKPPVINQFVIAGDAPSTSNPSVAVTWQYQGFATEYRVANTPYMAGAEWASLTSGAQSGSASHELAVGISGPRTVYLQLRNEGVSPVSASDTILLTTNACPRGPNGKPCNGDGVCNATAQCACNPDYSGTTCETVSQRCYGAIGNNCGFAEGFDVRNPLSTFGMCAGNLCMINAGSWEHDICCIRHRKNGPHPQQGSCSPVEEPPYAPQYCLDLFEKAKAHLLTDLAQTAEQATLGSPVLATLKPTWLTWVRAVDFKRSRSTDEIEMSVEHSLMCNPSGGTLLCEDSRFCCRRSAQPALFQPLGLPGPLCVCD